MVYDEDTKAFALYLIEVGHFWPAALFLQLGIPTRTLNKWKHDFEHGTDEEVAQIKRAWRRMQRMSYVKTDGKIVQLFPQQNH